jgi:predicted nucleic acid-binding protein
MKTKVYIETSVVSYLTSAPSRDLIVAAHQCVTRAWWDRRDRFDLFVSETVMEEVALGHSDAAAKRMAALHGLPVLAVSAAVVALARRLVASGAVPPKSGGDAIHIAAAAVNGLDVLLTWNCRHIANPTTRVRLNRCAERVGMCLRSCARRKYLEATDHVEGSNRRRGPRDP